MKPGLDPRATVTSLPLGSRVSTPLSEGRNRSQAQLGHPGAQVPGHQIGYHMTPGDATRLPPLWISRVIRQFLAAGSKTMGQGGHRTWNIWDAWQKVRKSHDTGTPDAPWEDRGKVVFVFGKTDSEAWFSIHYTVQRYTLQI